MGFEDQADSGNATQATGRTTAEFLKRPRRPLLRIWRHPRETIREIIDHDPHYWVLGLAAMSGLAEGLREAWMGGTSRVTPSVPLLVFTAVAGIVISVAYLYVRGGMVTLASRWLGSRAPAAHVRAASAWASVPMTAALLARLPQYLVFGFASMQDAMAAAQATPLLLPPLCLITTIDLVAAVWALVLAIACLSEVQGFTVARCFASLLLALPVDILMTVALPASDPGRAHLALNATST